VQSRRQATLSRNEVDVTLQPSSQRLARFVLGRQKRGGICAGVNLAAKDGYDQVRALWKVTVDRANADAGLFCDLSHGSIYA
jgi:hypothetical protein